MSIPPDPPAPYCTPDDLQAAAPDYTGSALTGRLAKLADDGDAAERLIARASRDVDRACRGPLDPMTGLPLFDPGELPEAQAEVLKWATAIAAIWRLAESEADLLAVTEMMPGNISYDRRAGRPPGAVVLEALAGSGLIHRSGTVAPDPAPPGWVAGLPVP